MRLLIALLLISFAGGLQAAPVHVMERDGLVIKLMSEPCSDPVSSVMIAMAPQEVQRGEWKAIESVWPMRDGSKQTFAGCWREVSKELAFAITNGKEREVSFLMVFADQQGMLMTKKQFLRKKGQVDA